MKVSASVTQLLAVCALLVAAEQSKAPPRFSDYPALGTYKGQNAPLQLTKNDTSFRTRLRYASKETPNFASHYIVTAWGCGSECVQGAVIDANTGRVYWFPFTICCWPDDVDRPIGYRLSSRMLVFVGLRNEKKGDEGIHYYEFTDGRFTSIALDHAKSHQ